MYDLLINICFLQTAVYTTTTKEERTQTSRESWRKQLRSDYASFKQPDFCCLKRLKLCRTRFNLRKNTTEPHFLFCLPRVLLQLVTWLNTWGGRQHGAACRRPRFLPSNQISHFTGSVAALSPGNARPPSDNGGELAAAIITFCCSECRSSPEKSAWRGRHYKGMPPRFWCKSRMQQSSLSVKDEHKERKKKENRWETVESAQNKGTKELWGK